MKYLKYFLVWVVLYQPGVQQANAQNINLTSDADSASFYLGYRYGKQIAVAGIDLNVYAMSCGLRNALAKTPTNLSDEEIGLFLQKYFNNLQTKSSAKNLKEGQDFLAANAKKPGIITLPSGLQYKVIKEGNGMTPQKTDNVELVYHGTLIDGMVFDSSKERNDTVAFQPNAVIAGFAEALTLMKEGSIWEIYIPSDLGYGENVRANGPIKPNSVLIFEIDLVRVSKGESKDFEIESTENVSK